MFAGPTAAGIATEKYKEKELDLKKNHYFVCKFCTATFNKKWNRDRHENVLHKKTTMNPVYPAVVKYQNAIPIRSETETTRIQSALRPKRSASEPLLADPVKRLATSPPLPDLVITSPPLTNPVKQPATSPPLINAQKKANLVDGPILNSQDSGPKKMTDSPAKPESENVEHAKSTTDVSTTTDTLEHQEIKESDNKDETVNLLTLPLNKEICITVLVTGK